MRMIKSARIFLAVALIVFSMPSQIYVADAASTSGMLFGPTAFWNTKLPSTQKIHANSSGLVSELVSNTKLNTPWINTTKYSTPLYIVDSSALKKPVSIVQNGKTLTWTALHAACQKGIPIPQNATAAQGTDGHITIWDRSSDKLYEFWKFKKDAYGKWTAAWGGILSNVSTCGGIMPKVLNPVGGYDMYGATATGLPVAGGTILLRELQFGNIPHALALNIVRPKLWKYYAWPAQRSDGFYTGGNAIMEGQRFRLPPNVTINPTWPPLLKMMVVAARDYGLVVRDQGGCVAFSAEDTTQYGYNGRISQFYSGLTPGQIAAKFPWSQLKALA